MPAFCYSDNEEIFRNECEAETREAVVLIAEEELGLVPGDAVWVGVREEVHPEVYIDADHVLETVGDGVYEAAGEVSEGWPDVSGEDIEKLQEKLAAAFKAWMEETKNAPEFYVVGDVTRHVIGGWTAIHAAERD